MSYLKIYRGEFSNTLPGVDNVPVDQVVRIDISDTTEGSDGETIVGNIIVIGSSLGVAPPLITPTASLAVRTALWQTFADFFTVGKQIRITGSVVSDGDYIIIGPILQYPPTNVIPDDPGSITMNLNVPAPIHTGDNNVTFEIIATTEIIPLAMDGDPLHISVIDDDEDKFTPIRGKQAEIKIHTNTTIDIDTFCEGDDERFYVEVFVDTLIIFRGYLIIPDMQQDFLPDPNVLTLTATDNLGTLKDVPLTDSDNAVPQFDHKLIDYIQWSLRKTGVIQNINVVNNLKHGSGTLTSDVIFAIDVDSNNVILTPATDFFYKGQRIRVTGTVSNDGEFTVIGSGLNLVQITIVNEAVVAETASGILFEDISSESHFYDAVYLDAKTFEANIGILEDCYTCLTKILGEDSVLFQAKGEWWIVRIDEIEDFEGVFQMDTATFDSDGVYQSNAIRIFTKAIGINDTMWMSNDDAVVIPDRALSFVKETYKFENPQELICNIALERGELIGDLPNETIKGAVYNVQNYIPECWTLKKNISTDLTTDTDGWIKTYSQNGYVKNRSISIENSPSDDFYKWVSDVRVPMNQGDKFTIGCEFIYKTNLSLAGPGSHVTIAMYYIRLYGDDGTFWTLYATDGPDAGFFAGSGTIPKWIPSNAAWTLNPQLCYYETQSDDGDFSSPVRSSIDSAPLPVSGRLEIGLVSSIQTSTSAKEFQSISFDYIPFINGSYQRYTGQYHKVSQIGDNKAARDNQVFMSDSPSLLFKGAMKIFNGVEYVLTFSFTDHNHVTPKLYGEIQAYAVWNQYRNSARNFDCNIDLLDSATTETSVYDGVDLIHKIDLTDVDKNTLNRYFLILHYEQDFNLLAMKCFIASLFRTDIGKVYTDEHIFKFITAA